uniref:Retrovirus-related Pol polyprotein from transposon TNT 1-94 n=1 Tax=Tanacetum cinerariifolium TaxID=118510 RepID=A0A6L2JXP0_TANCI|nr:retrovirus-related Pol polyprotein from transposon TNT 1-94 [Tanacetum cinerariifolium]
MKGCSRSVTTKLTRSVPAVVTRSVPAVVSRSVTVVETRSVPAVESRSVPAVVSRSVPAVVTRSVPAVESKSVPAVVSRSVPAVVSRSVHAIVSRSVPAVESRSVHTARSRSVHTARSRSVHTARSRSVHTTRTPQSNGMVERKNRTLQEMSRTMLNEQSLPQKFWCNAVDTSTYILNQILIRAILGKTSYELSREPKNVNEALGDESWIVSMQEELNQLIANDVWELVPQTRNMTIIGTKWVFRNKLDENDVVSQNKARLVAQGYHQQKSIDYDETYGLVARLESIRILLAYACALKFKLFQMDVKSSFLNGFINEEIYVAQPPRFIDFEKPDHVYKL